MKIGTLKGALLEFIVRNLLTNCGFTNVKSDGLYSFESGGLFFVNGKGAAHDADIIMNPPIQMPFHYPTQLIFECKAYGKKVGMPIVRAALGLRIDLNDFEIVTEDSLKKRKNNRRNHYATETRNRFLYQVGVASINEFSKPAIEFGTNNKIPLLSLSWFFGQAELEDINNLSQTILDSYDEDDLKNVYSYFKDREGDIDKPKYDGARKLLYDSDNELSKIIGFSNLVIEHSYIGLLETGDMVFLFAESRNNVLNENYDFFSFKAKIYYLRDKPNQWKLLVTDHRRSSEFHFFLPKKLFNYWEQFDLNKKTALDMKEQFLSKIFVFNKARNPTMPFSIINVDKQWLESARQDSE